MMGVKDCAAKFTVAFSILLLSSCAVEEQGASSPAADSIIRSSAGTSSEVTHETSPTRAAAAESTEATAGELDDLFWAARMPPATYADPPATIKQLGERADLVAVGSVLQVVPDGKWAMGEGRPIYDVERLTIRVHTGAKAESDIALQITRFTTSVPESKHQPTGRYLFFLSEDADGRYHCTYGSICAFTDEQGVLRNVVGSPAPSTDGVEWKDIYELAARLQP